MNRKGMGYLSASLVVCAIISLIMVGATLAVERGPWKATTVVRATADTSVTLPISDSGRLELSYITFKAVAPTVTQTVKIVSGIVTNTYGTKIVTATDGFLAITSTPPLFYGDKVLIGGTKTNAVTVTVIGNLFD